MYICICICVYVYIQTYIYRHVRLQTHTHPCIIVSPAVQVPLRKSAQFMMAQAVPVLLQLDEYTKVDSNMYKSWVNDPGVIEEIVRAPHAIAANRQESRTRSYLDLAAQHRLVATLVGQPLQVCVIICLGVYIHVYVHIHTH